MEPIRFPLATDLDCRDATLNTDSFNKNVFFEAGEDGQPEIVKRPGLDVNVQAQGVGLGVYHFGDKTFQFIDGNYTPPYTDIAYGNGVFVVLANTTTTFTPASVLVSQDGLEWQAFEIPNVENLGERSTLYFAGEYFFIFEDLTNVNGSARVFKSIDGKVWEQLNLGYLQRGNTPGSAAFGNGVYVITGVRTNNQVIVLTSSDAETWTISYTIGTSFSSRFVTFNGSVFVIRFGLRSLVSSNGVSWTEYTQSSTLNGKGIVANPVSGTILAYSGTTISYSTNNGVTFTNIILESSPRVISKISYNNGEFVSLNDNGTLKFSLDGISWGATPGSLTDYSLSGFDWKAIAHRQNMYVAVLEALVTPGDPFPNRIGTSTALLTWIETEPVIGQSIIVTRD